MPRVRVIAAPARIVPTNCSPSWSAWATHQLLHGAPAADHREVGARQGFRSKRPGLIIAPVRFRLRAGERQRARRVAAAAKQYTPGASVMPARVPVRVWPHEAAPKAS